MALDGRIANTDTRLGGGVLSHGHLFGLKTHVKSNVHFVEEHLVAYPCGHNVVFLHLETRSQQVPETSPLLPFDVDVRWHFQAVSVFGLAKQRNCIAPAVSAVCSDIVDACFNSSFLLR